MGLKVYNSCCGNCLFSSDRIVSADRAKKIEKEVLEKDTYFICHVATMEQKDIMCHAFYKKHKDKSRHVAMAEWLGVLTFVPQPEKQKLASHKIMHNHAAKRRNSKPEQD